MTLRKMSMAALALVTLVATTGFTAGSRTPSWRLSDTGVTARFRGLAPVDDKVAWVAGSAGTILRTVDGGRSWLRVDPPGTADLQFRDIEAFDADHAVALTIGEGDQSRLYATADGGRSWTETFRNDDPAAFYDCVTFLDRRHGLALSDPVGGKFRILATADGGRSWRVQPSTGMPPALAGEFAFAASGTCLVSADHFGAGRAWFATGGGERARVFSTVNGGRTWRTAKIVPGEYRSGAAWLGGNTALAVGPTGSDISRDGGRTWTEFDGGSFDAVLCAAGACWASGEQGRVAKLTWRR